MMEEYDIHDTKSKYDPLSEAEQSKNEVAPCHGHCAFYAISLISKQCWCSCFNAADAMLGSSMGFLL
jgi:hypothetical protein